MRRKRINTLFVLNSFGTGGSERVVFDIARRLNRKYYEPFVVGINPPCTMEELFQENNIWCSCLVKNKGVDLSLMIKIHRIIKEKEIHVVNAHHFSPMIHSTMGALANNCRFVYTEHTAVEIRRIPLYWKIIGGIILNICNGAIGISHSCTHQLRKSFFLPVKKSVTIINAIDTARFSPTRKNNREIVRSSIGLQPNEIVIGIIANLRPEKNHANLLQATKILLDKGYPVKILIVGDGPVRQDLKQLIEELGIRENVLLLGIRFDVDVLYQVMDIYCLCSHYEGLPLSILEAMSSQLPVVGTDVTGIQDVIQHNENGILVKPNSPIDLAQGFICLLRDKVKSQRLAENGFRYVHRSHGIIPWIMTYEDFFRKIVK